MDKIRRESTASQETFVSLQQLDPSPIDSPYEEGDYNFGQDGEKDGLLDGRDAEKDIEPLKRSGTNFTGLSGSSNGGGHSSIYYRILPLSIPGM
jgi:hypothetical protein